MFSTFLKFEIRYWLRGMMIYVFLLIISALIFGAASVDEIQVGGAISNTSRNAPFIVQVFYMITSVLSCLMVTAFVNGAASRDFAYNTHQLLFTKPMSKTGYLMGRFWGAICVAMIPMLGASLGVILAKYMPWVDAEKWQAISWGAHLWGIVCFAIPNTIIIGCIVFAIAVWTRSTMASFLGVLGLLVAVAIANVLTSNLDNEFISSMLNPFGANAFGNMTKYWTVADKNTRYLTLSGYLLQNRILWLSIGAVILGITCWRFSFSTGNGPIRRALHELIRELRAFESNIPVIGGMLTWGVWMITSPIALLTGYQHVEVDDTSVAQTLVEIPKVSRQFGFSAGIKQLLSQINADFFTTLKSPVFIVVMLFAMVETFASLSLRTSEGFGLASLPVTYQQISSIRGSLYIYLLACMTFYAGVVVWKERDAKLDEVYDALPHSTWISFLGKLIAIMLIITCAVFVGMMCGIIHQTINGYTRYQLPLYFRELFVHDMPQLFCFVVLAMFVHVISPNKYVGYFGFIILIIVNIFLWNGLGVESILAQYGQLPSYTYSDMFRFLPFASALGWIGVYWVAFAVLLCTIAIMLWVRGRERGFFRRIKIMFSRWNGGLRIASLLFLLAWAGTGAWAYYNTKVLNTFRTSDEETELLVRYEKNYKSDQDKPQPRVTKVRFNIDLYPAKRALLMNGVQTIVNKNEQPIDEIIVVIRDEFETTVEIDGANLKDDDKELGYRTYSVDPAMQPGEEREMKFTVQYEPKGFENSVSVPQVVQNGTFFNNAIAPQIGYQRAFEITDRDDREENGLGEPVIALPLDPNNLAGRRNTYMSNFSDWVDVETFISTSGDQIAIAPGSLRKSWKEDGRNHFHYKVDHQSLNFYSFISADYEVERSEWNGVDVEVYYHKDHHWNVGKMVRSIKKSLEYYSENFGPYKHKQARIIEFPRISSFAQAFPGTMPYSEGIGFIADIKEVDDIDMVYYVVAHEMAHQWWAHQVIGANMRGATLLSETMAQYSALMVMEKEYGRDMMRKFLRYEMDNYLESRGSERLDERPLLEVEPTQGYVHYRKGSVVMYYVKELIGEDKVNLALRNLVEKFAYKGPPYPTSVDLVDSLREQSPEKYHSVLKDLFEEITLFGNRTTEATYTELPDGKFEVTIDVECEKFQANSKGKETDVELNDWIDIGAFAQPEYGRKYGETLHRERVHITKKENTFKFTTDEKPHRAGIDPFSLLIDRVPGDNTKRVTKADD